MPKIEWYGPEKGQGSTGDIVSHTYPVVNAMRSGAQRIAFQAAFNLDSYPERRKANPEGHAKIGMQQEKLDFYVYLYDPRNKAAAQGIENGHWTHGYRKRRDGTLGKAEGPIRNGKHGDGGGARWVEGLHVLRDAAISSIRKG